MFSKLYPFYSCKYFFIKGIGIATFAVSAFLTAPTVVSAEEAGGESVRIMGSSTVYPFVAAAAEEFYRATSKTAPVVESTGTGGGFAQLCGKDSKARPDMVNASRPIAESERKECVANAGGEPIAFALGYDGVVLANNVESPTMNITLEQLRLALAKFVEKDGEVVENDVEKWSDIDPSFPEVDILVYGPPVTSGTREVVDQFVLEHGCTDSHAFEEAFPDMKERVAKCRLFRTDGGYSESSENDNLIIQKLVANKGAFGIFGYNFLEQNEASVQGAKIGDVEPTYDDIAGGEYPLTRPLYVYVNASSKSNATLKAFLKELLSEHALGEDGYLVYKGLISPSEEQKKENLQKLLDM